MTSVAAPAQGNPIPGFVRNARVEYDLADGTTVRGRLAVPGTDKIGSAHGIELDTDVQPCELHWVGTGLVRLEGGAPATTKTPKAPKLTPAMEAAMEQLTGTLNGKVRKGYGITLGTARALHRRGLAYLEENVYADGSWLLTLIEPAVREITDADLAGLPAEEAEVLRPLTPASRYRVLRHAHIARTNYSQEEKALAYGDPDRYRMAVLRKRTELTLAWKRGEMSDRKYMEHLDLAGEQWQSARTNPTNIWSVSAAWGETVLTVEATTGEECDRLARQIIAADPAAYPTLRKGFGRRRLTVGEVVERRRATA